MRCTILQKTLWHDRREVTLTTAVRNDLILFGILFGVESKLIYQTKKSNLYP